MIPGVEQRERGSNEKEERKNGTLFFSNKQERERDSSLNVFSIDVSGRGTHNRKKNFVRGTYLITLLHTCIKHIYIVKYSPADVL